jgi:hypothetical protein
MNKEPSKIPSTAAQRMRLYRSRRRKGLRGVLIPLHTTDIDALIRMGFLAEEQRGEVDALRDAILDVVYRAMQQEGCLVPLAHLDRMAVTKRRLRSNANVVLCTTKASGCGGAPDGPPH